jgi:hypothetical protein
MTLKDIRIIGGLLGENIFLKHQPNQMFDFRHRHNYLIIRNLNCFFWASVFTRTITTLVSEPWRNNCYTSSPVKIISPSNNENLPSFSAVVYCISDIVFMAGGCEGVRRIIRAPGPRPT